MIKKGDIFYSSWLNIESARTEKSYIEIEEWHVTKIDKEFLHLKQKNLLTWGKLSSTHFDYGFLPNTPKHYTDKIKIGENFNLESKVPTGYHKTKISAHKSIKPHLEFKIKELTRLLNRVNKSINKKPKTK